MTLSTYARAPKGWRRCRAILALPAGVSSEHVALLLCELPSGHAGPHQETGAVHTGGPLYEYEIRWSKTRKRHVKFTPLSRRIRSRI